MEEEINKRGNDNSAKEKLLVTKLQNNKTFKRLRQRQIRKNVFPRDLTKINKSTLL